MRPAGTETSARVPETVVLYVKQVKTAFYKWGKRAVHILRYYSACRLHFPGRAWFHVSELLEILHAYYGYSNSREAKRTLLADLRSAPQWFRELDGERFSFKSIRKIIGRERLGNNFETVSPSMLHQDNAASWTDKLINMATSDQEKPVDDFCKQTGYKRSRIYKAFGNGGLERDQIRVTISIHDTAPTAYAERKALWAKGTLSEVLYIDNQYHVTVCTGVKMGKVNTAPTDKRASLQYDELKTVVKPEHRETTVFRVIDVVKTVLSTVTGAPRQYVPAVFVSDEAERLFLKRHTEVVCS